MELKLNNLLITIYGSHQGTTGMEKLQETYIRECHVHVFWVMGGIERCG